MQVAVPSNPAAPDMPVDSATEGGDEHLHVPHPHLFARDQADSSNDDFEQFTPGPPMIKTTLCLVSNPPSLLS